MKFKGHASAYFGLLRLASTCFDLLRLASIPDAQQPTLSNLRSATYAQHSNGRGMISSSTLSPLGSDFYQEKAISRHKNANITSKR